MMQCLGDKMKMYEIVTLKWDPIYENFEDFDKLLLVSSDSGGKGSATNGHLEAVLVKALEALA